MSSSVSSRGASSAARPPQRRNPARLITAAAIFLLGIVALVVFVVPAINPQEPQQVGQDQVYGKVPPGEPTITRIGDIAQRDGEKVTVRGAIVDMGPAMGCWLVIDDDTGEVLVQTDPMLVIDQSVRGRTLTATGVTEFVNGGMGFTGRRLQVLTSGVRIAGGSR